MLRNILFILCSLIVTHTQAQFCIWADAGLAQSRTQFHYFYSNADYTNISYSPRVSINCLGYSNKRINIGLSSYWETYSINYHPAKGSGGHIVSVGNSGNSTIADINDQHTSSYLYIAPLLDYKIDDKSNWHLYLLPSVGLNLSGNDKPGTTKNTNEFINKEIFRMGLQIQRRFEITPNSLITATIGYSIMSGSMSSLLEQYSSNSKLNPQVFSLGIGYMRDYKRKMVTRNFPFSISADIGYSVPIITGMSTTNYATNTKITADNELYYSLSILRNKDKKFNYGLTASIGKNSINLTAEHYDSYIYYYSSSSSSLIDDHQSTYLYLSPCLDWSIDRERNWHVSLLPSLGIFMSGRDKGNIFANYSHLAGGDTIIYPIYGNTYYYRSFNSAEDIKKLIFKTALQFKRKFLIQGNNSLSLIANYSFMFGHLTNITSQYKELRPGVFTLGISYGLMEFRKKEENSKSM